MVPGEAEGSRDFVEDWLCDPAGTVDPAGSGAGVG